MDKRAASRDSFESKVEELWCRLRIQTLPNYVNQVESAAYWDLFPNVLSDLQDLADEAVDILRKCEFDGPSMVFTFTKANGVNTNVIDVAFHRLWLIIFVGLHQEDSLSRYLVMSSLLQLVPYLSVTLLDMSLRTVCYSSHRMIDNRGIASGTQNSRYDAK